MKLQVLSLQENQNTLWKAIVVYLIYAVIRNRILVTANYSDSSLLSTIALVASVIIATGILVVLFGSLRKEANDNAMYGMAFNRTCLLLALVLLLVVTFAGWERSIPSVAHVFELIATALFLLVDEIVLRALVVRWFSRRFGLSGWTIFYASVISGLAFICAQLPLSIYPLKLLPASAVITYGLHVGNTVLPALFIDSLIMSTEHDAFIKGIITVAVYLSVGAAFHLQKRKLYQKG